MSRGLGKVQRWVLAELDTPTPAGHWPPWITVEALAARYLGLAEGELVAVLDEDDWWRSASSGVLRTTNPTAYDHLIGLSVDRWNNVTGSQHLTRSAVESVRRAAKNLAAAQLIDTAHLSVADRGARHTNVYRDGSGNVTTWSTRAHVTMLACRRLLTEPEREAEAPRIADRRARHRAAMAILKG